MTGRKIPLEGELAVDLRTGFGRRRLRFRVTGEAAVSSRPRDFATRRLPGAALDRLAARVELDLWSDEAAPSAVELIDRAR